MIVSYGIYFTYNIEIMLYLVQHYMHYEKSNFISIGSCCFQIFQGTGKIKLSSVGVLYFIGLCIQHLQNRK